MLLCAASLHAADTLPPPAANPVEFAKDVRPILARSCYRCHGPEKQKSSFRLDRRLAAFKGGDFGKAIVPHKSEESPLIRYVARLESGLEMPPEGEGEPLTAAEIGILRRWIDDGATWPADPDEPKPTDWWSLKPLVRPHVPHRRAGFQPASEAIRQAGSLPYNGIDAFIHSKLHEQGLSPSPEADRATLIRRITYDLHGLPPTPEEIAAFEQDQSPDAHERLVDRLLASPRYGERWARHWLDVVHYGESNGYGMDRPRLNAWPYRDYVIASLNADKPYARFVQEQLAADVLFPNEPQLIAALGFAAAGPFNQSALVEQVDGTECKKIALNLDRDDMVTTVASTFLSMTVHCARCHEHKFDPIGQRDYYRLQAVFAGVGRAERPFDSDPTIRQRRDELVKLKSELSRVGFQPASNTDALAGWKPTLQELEQLTQAQAVWEQSLIDQAAVWTPLEIERIESTHANTTFTRQDDGSYLAGGEAGEKDTYRIHAKSSLARVTAVRVEVLPDDRLPSKGPGRHDNGNLHLSEIRFGLATAEKPTWLPLQNASADFNQQGWAVERAIDGNATTAWGIHPEAGKPHQAVFEVKEPRDVAGAGLVIELDQLHGRRHLIGRLRVSVTDKPAPVRISQLPADVLAILARPASERNEAEKQRLFVIHRIQFVSDQIAALPPQQLVWAIQADFPGRRNYKAISEPYPIHVLRRGNVMQPQELVAPGGLECVTTLPAELPVADPKNEGERRAALAHWITSPENMLAWRSIANRVWHYHFGRGLVDSPNDFGRMGSLPTHPELLDWLACEVGQGSALSHEPAGSLKSLHRMIVTSATYRQSSARHPEFSKIDCDNRFLWRMNRPRLDAESLRDSLLAASGTLDTKMGGPAVMQFKYEDPNMEVSPRVDYMAFDVDSPASFRRGVYRFLFRNVNDPLLEAFDVSDPSLSVAKRNMTITSLQALSLWNNRFVLRQCEHLAARLERESPDLPGRIDRAYRLLLGRGPTAEESAQLTAYAQKHSLASACRVLVNSNAFLFVR